ncbi:TPA: hypothetical protein IAA82_07040 [Candidatus Galligastranaerophilus gallistercoris]|nr:hypothetical protein [Candidatus Galligastranaerophilus gallistercoris]
MVDEEQMRIIREVSRQNRKTKPKLSKKTANAFNLQAFVFPVIYNFIYKRKTLAFIFLILTWLPHLTNKFISSSMYPVLVTTVTVLTVILALISGLTGNRAAYDARNYDDEEDFIKSQRFWLPVAVIGIIIHIIIWPVQQTGHNNTSHMMKFAEVKDDIKQIIQKGYREGDILGINTVGEERIPSYFAKYSNGTFDGVDTIVFPNGVKIKVEGYLRECGTRAQNTYYEQKTACATVTVDVNGDAGPNETMSLDDLKKVRSLVNRSVKLKDVYTLYAYSDDLAPKSGTIEQFALERFEKN